MTSPAGLRIGVATGDDEAEAGRRAADAVEDAGATAVRASPAALADRDVDAAVTVGEPALLSFVRADPAEETPVLPVGAGRGVCAVPTADLAAGVRSAVAALTEERATDRRVPILAVAVDGRRHRALFDLTLVTAEAARISEYALSTGDSTVADVRADGVVAATPAGTHGYAGTVDAPLIAPGTGTLAVVPVAPFVTDRERWVLPTADFAVRVTRDEGDVTLFVDDREVATVDPDSPVTVAREATLRTLVVPESLSFWGSP